MKKNPRIFLIGGGTGGHIFPLRNLANEFIHKKWDTQLIFADAPLDRKIAAENFTDLETHFFKTEKIRRYFDWRNFFAPFLIIRSIFTAYNFLVRHEPHALFFKGGFVGFPFLIAAKYYNFRTEKSAEKIRLYSHESDLSVGALTKMARFLCDQVFESFGTPPLPLFFESSGKQKKSAEKLPLLLIFGGSQGALAINKLFQKHADSILKKFRVFLVSGVGKKIQLSHKNFMQVELLPATELSQKIKQADLIISRAGANSLFEIIAAKKPSIIIPYPAAARDHQTDNANFFARQNLCTIHTENSQKDFLQKIDTTLQSKIIADALKKSEIKNSAEKICQLICDNTEKH